jgi:hypothetical protein
MPSRACLEIKLPNIRPAAVARPFLTLASRTQHQAQGCVASRQASQSVSGWIRTSRSFNQYRDILLQPNALAYCTETILDVVLYSFGYLRSNLACNLSILRMHVPIPPPFFHHDASPPCPLKTSAPPDGESMKEEIILELWSSETIQVRLDEKSSHLDLQCPVSVCGDNYNQLDTLAKWSS